MSFYGEKNCEGIKGDGKNCENKAYYSVKNKFLCGVHSRGKKRNELPKEKESDKRKKLENTLKLHNQSIKEISELNKGDGTIRLFKMRMMKSVPLISGYLNVFPNFRHQNREDGFGCSSLSPMTMGPVDHKQPDLPLSKNLENFHQGNKCFPEEVEDGKIKSIFYKRQLEMYQDSIPHRHKTDGRGNVPLFSVWRDKKGKEKRMSYIESRQFYCEFYSRFALESDDFNKLKKMLKEGINLQICGYDAYQPDKTLEEHYLDPSRPFGHELVLYSLLTLKKSEYPWKKYKTEEF